MLYAELTSTVGKSCNINLSDTSASFNSNPETGQPVRFAVIQQAETMNTKLKTCRYVFTFVYPRTMLRNFMGRLSNFPDSEVPRRHGETVSVVALGLVDGNSLGVTWTKQLAALNTSLNGSRALLHILILVSKKCNQ